MKVTTNQSKMWRIFIGFKKDQLPTNEIPAYTRLKLKVIGWSFHIEHIINPVTSVKKDAEQEDEATIMLKMKSLILFRTERSDRWLPISTAAWSRTDVHQDWLRVQGLVTIPQFSLDLGPTKDKWSTKKNSPWRCWAQQIAYEESYHNSRIGSSMIT
jgi:hypothetical protein